MVDVTGLTGKGSGSTGSPLEREDLVVLMDDLLLESVEENRCRLFLGGGSGGRGLVGAGYRLYCGMLDAEIVRADLLVEGRCSLEPRDRGGWPDGVFSYGFGGGIQPSVDHDGVLLLSMGEGTDPTLPRG